MANIFRRLPDGREWGIQVSDASLNSGMSVTVTKRNGQTVPMTLGELVSTDAALETRLFRIASATAEAPTPQQPQNVGDLSGINTLFNRARQHLRRPSIVIGQRDRATLRISVALETARFPNTINVFDENRRFAGRRFWYGRIHQDGRFEAYRGLPATEVAALTERLRDFAADPARAATEHGRLTGRCCFCNHPLEDERSTAVGYGPVCAGHFGLAWGERPAEFAAPVAASLNQTPTPAPTPAPRREDPLFRNIRQALDTESRPRPAPRAALQSEPQIEMRWDDPDAATRREGSEY